MFYLGQGEGGQSPHPHAWSFPAPCVFRVNLTKAFKSFLFWYASGAYQASLVEPWFVFWRDAVDRLSQNTHGSLICWRSIPKKERLGIYRTQIRAKTRRYFFSYCNQSGVLVIWRVNQEKNSASILFSNSSSVIF